MSAGLTENNGKVEMFYAGNDVPWHGLGTKLDNPATAEEALIAAGLNWGVKKEPVYLASGMVVDGFYSNVRSDNGKPLGIVGERYEPLNNKDAFRLFDAIVGEKLAMYHTAGSLGVGERVWILAKLPGHIKVVGEDVIEKYLLLTNSHDGSSAVQMMFSPVRVVCQNTLNLALRDTSESSRRVRSKHTINIGLRLDSFRERLGIISAQYSMFEEMSRKLATVQLTSEAWQAYVKSTGLIPDTKKADGEMGTKAANIMEEVSAMFEKGRGNDLPGVRGTLWGGFNAIAEYVDYGRTTRAHSGKSPAEARANSLLFGSGAALKQAAWDRAFDIVKGRTVAPVVADTPSQVWPSNS